MERDPRSRTLPPGDWFPMFQRITVGQCHVQTAIDRFGDGAKVAIRDRERASLGIHPQTGEMPFTWPSLHSDDEDEPERSIFKLIPSTQGFRNNLTALSQVHNLYFVAYQGRIFVYKPRDFPEHRLPRRADLQLMPKPSVAARSIGGYLDARRPHIINQVITGMLGNQEIVVACFDHGDVVAYYVKDVEDQISRPRGKEGTTRSGPMEFFHENVGMSAWGLAVHQSSRLIAVSSNRHEVTVFAFALKPLPSAIPRDNKRDLNADVNVRKRMRNWRIIVLLGENADNIPNICFIDDERGYADKVCAVDIKGALWVADIWKMGQRPTYIPPLSNSYMKSEEYFPSASRGWGVLAIPAASFLEVKTMEELYGIPPGLVDFTTSRGSPLANIRKSLKDVPGNPCSPPARSATVDMPDLPAMLFQGQPLDQLIVEQGVNELPWIFNDASDDEFDGSDHSQNAEEEMEGDGEEEDEEEEEEESESEGNEGNGAPANTQLNASLLQPSLNSLQAEISETLQAMARLGPRFDKMGGALYTSLSRRKASDILASFPKHVFEGREPDWRHTDAFRGRRDMIYFPHTGQVKFMPRNKKELLEFLERRYEHVERINKDEGCLERLGNGLHLLRTYEKDIELCGFRRSKETGAKEVSTLCPDAAVFGRFRELGLRHHFSATSRLNMIAHVPELSMVVIGSPTGRVVLLTLTKKVPASTSAEGIREHGFRVEWILPTWEDEVVHRKVLRPLHGIAVGPIQVSKEHNWDSPELPRRVRLMMHYRNHDIFTYEITRQEQTGKLCVF